MNPLAIAASSGSFSGLVIAAAFQYFRDRRRQKAKALVAEQTVPEQVDAARLANMDRRLGLVEKAHDAQVESLQATITNLKDRLDVALGRISLLEQRVQFEDTRYRAAVRYIRSLRYWISQHVPGLDPPAMPASLEADFDDTLPPATPSL